MQWTLIHFTWFIILNAFQFSYSNFITSLCPPSRSVFYFCFLVHWIHIFVSWRRWTSLTPIMEKDEPIFDDWVSMKSRTLPMIESRSPAVQFWFRTGEFRLPKVDVQLSTVDFWLLTFNVRVPTLNGRVLTFEDRVLNFDGRIPIFDGWVSTESRSPRQTQTL